MTPQEKIDLINTLHYKVSDYDADGECCYYVHVPVDEETKEVLKQLDYEDYEIDMLVEDWDGDGTEYIDLAQIGFEFAEWWYNDKGFSLDKPEE